MIARITEKSRVLVELPLLIFVRIADGDGAMTAHEMERFEELIANPSWCSSPLLQRSLIHTREEKPAFWKRYAKGDIRVGVDAVEASIDTVLTSISSEERVQIEADLAKFCAELLAVAKASAGLFRRDTAAASEFDAVTALIRRPSARSGGAATSQETTAARGAASLPIAFSADLLTAEVSPDYVWQRGKIRLTCVDVVDETHDVRTFHFVSDPGRLFRFLPGQFITFELPIDGKIVRRSYTISATPSRPHVLSVTIKRIPDGLVSNWMHENMTPGTQVFGEGPFGKFTCVGEAPGPYLFVSGGSGVTPVMSMARWLCDTASGADIHFVHFARSPDDLIYAAELDYLSRRHRNFKTTFVVSRPGEAWSGPTGHISHELLPEIVPDLHARHVYLCGPVPFMVAAKEALEKLDYNMDNFRQESFGGAPSSAKPAQASGVMARIVFSGAGSEIDCATSDTVLDIALKAGVDIAYSCRAGQCGSCKVPMSEGKVDHDCSDGLGSDDAEAGFILACQARPIGRVVIAV
ncbi:ferredoxin-NADP reductase [Rhizobium aquaticum]|uniref:Ferredoxin-NADP reductase n=1 Tax=Rhizobium aquaticum TaxID=1549636 RepID=A0ABV2J691_9HYPH